MTTSTTRRGRKVKRKNQSAISALIDAGNKEKLISMCQATGLSQADGLDLLIDNYALSIETFGTKYREPDDYMQLLDRTLEQYLLAIGLGSTAEYRVKVLADFVKGIADCA